MKTVSIQAKNMTSNKRIIALIVLLLLSSVRMFGQESKNEIVEPIVVKTVPVAATLNTTSQMELVSWFMGSKQLQMSNGNSTIGTTSTNNSGKKQFINLGMTPNRILSRTFLKKAINHESTIA